jgi:signal transduction histidine kinase/CheY-like chemotaxis protein
MNLKQRLLGELVKEPIRVVGITFVAAFVALLGFQFVTERESHRSKIEVQAAQTAQRLGISLSMNKTKSDELHASLDTLVTEPSIGYAALVGPSRSISQSSGEMRTGTSPTDLLREGFDTPYDYSLTGMRLTLPLTSNRGRAGWLYVESHLTEAYVATAAYSAVSGLVLAGVLGLTILVLKRRLTLSLRPIGEMADTLDRVVRTGNYAFRAPRFPNEGEQGKVVDRVNSLLKTVETQTVELHERRTELANAKRVESIGLLASGVANDLNNILGPLLAFPDMVAKKLEPGDAESHEYLKMMKDSASAAAQASQDLLAMANRKAAAKEPIDLKKLVLKTIKGAGFKRVLEQGPKIRLETRLEENVWIDGSSPHLNRAIHNLLVNAVEAMSKDGGSLLIDTSAHTYAEGENRPKGLSPGSYVLVCIRDTGTGMKKDELAKMFEPFYTTKDSKTSSGLGLAVVDGVAQEHGAFVQVDSRKGRGTRVELYFPASKLIKEGGKTRLPRKKKTLGQTKLTGNERVLIVDDFEVQRRLTERILSQKGYKTKCVPSGREAIEVLGEEKFDIIVLDMIMEDGFDGLDTFLEVQKLAPGIKCVIMTGLAESDRVTEALKLGANDCLSKPYTMDDLAIAVRRALDEPPSKQSKQVALPI